MGMQKQYFTEYCKNNNGLEMYKIYADEGISGKSLKNRKAFDSMIKDAKSGCFDVILVKDFSRLARNTVDLLTTIRMLKGIGVEIIFVNYNMNNMGDSELIVTVMGAIAQEESAALSRKLKLSKGMNAEKGRVPNFVFGYDRIDLFTLVPNEYEANWVKKIFEMYVYEGMGTAKIAECLNNNNVITKKKISKGWTQHVIICLLRNELYTGKVINKKSEISDFKTGKRKEFDRGGWLIVDKPEFRIIDDELFSKAQKILSSRKDKFRLDKKRPSSKYPLSNLIVCANDGYSFRRCSRKYSEDGKIYKWWTCSYRNAKGATICNNVVRLNEEQMYSAIIEFFQSICGNKEDIIKQVRDYAGKELKRRYEHNDNRKELLTELRSLETKRSRLIDLYSDGEINKDCLNDKLRPVSGRIEEINTTLNVYANYENIGVDIEKVITNFIKKIEVKTESLLSNVFLKTIFEKFLVHEDGKITVVLKIDYDTGLSMDIPFGEMVEDDTDSTVPGYNNRTQGCYRKIEPGQARACK